MPSPEDFIVIKALKKRGVYQKDIAAELGVHPKTVSRALKRDGAPKNPRPKRPSKLDPYKQMIDRYLKEGVWNAQVILREIEAAGYTGKGTILRDYIRPKRVLRQKRSTVRFETEPGQFLRLTQTRSRDCAAPATVQALRAIVRRCRQTRRCLANSRWRCG